MKKTLDKTTLTLLAISIISIIGHFIIFPRLPEKIPIQWASDGSINTWGPKYMDLVLAFLPIAVIFLRKVMPAIDPRKANYKKHSHAYNILHIGVTLLLVACSWLSALSALGFNVNIQTLIPVGIGILFIALGNTLPQIRSNYFFGIKTPWALEDPDIWRRTHRFGGILVCLWGVLFILAAFIGNNTFVSVVLVPSLLGSIALMYLYSYLLYRKKYHSNN